MRAWVFLFSKNIVHSPVNHIKCTNYIKGKYHFIYNISRSSLKFKIFHLIVDYSI